MSFNVSLYMTKSREYFFSLPIDSARQYHYFLDEQDIPENQRLVWKPNWVPLNTWEQSDTLNVMLENNFFVISEEHSCREVAVSKGISFSAWLDVLNGIVRNSYIVLSYPDQIPEPFKKIVKKHLLMPLSVNNDITNIRCDLDADEFAIGMHPANWKNPWLSLLTYFVKYGEFLESIFGDDEADLDDVVETLLRSWTGEVGFYTAFAFWRYSVKDYQAINGFDTRNGSHFNGIHKAMDAYTKGYNPTSLVKFCHEFGLSTDRMSKGYLDIHQNLLREAGLALPRWYLLGCANHSPLSYSPEYNNYMGWDEDGDVYDDDDYYDDDYDDDYDDEEEW